jgi:signal transduction histidine kinase
MRSGGDDGGHVQSPVTASAPPRWWLLAGAAAALSGAGWMRSPGEPYVIACALATVALGALARLGARRAIGIVATFTAATLTGLFAVGSRAIGRLEESWDAYHAALEFESAARLERELVTAAATLRNTAQRALDAPSDPEPAFNFLESLTAGPDERGVVLYRAGRPAAWAGRVRASTDTMNAPLGAAMSPFYLTLYAAAARDDRRAVATLLVHAEPPADRIASPLDARVAALSGVRGFEYVPAAQSRSGYARFVAGADTLFAARPSALEQAEVRLRVLEKARVRGMLAVGLLLLLLLVEAWRRPSSLARRLGTLVVALATIAIVPFNAFSNATVLFDPSVYFASLGGPFTGSVGVLVITSALALLGVLAVLRARLPVRSRWPAAGLVLLIAALGPFLLRDLARGINPPPWGVPLPLWLAWQVALFLAAAAVLLTGVSAGRAALGARRGIAPWLAPMLAAIAAIIAPALWDAPGSWPGWYPAVWILAIGALALTRRTRGFLINAALVSALGAVTLVWGTAARKRVQLAERDVTGLDAVDSTAFALLERLGRDLARATPPQGRAELLQRYVRSDLDDAGYPVELTQWAPLDNGGFGPVASLVLSDIERAPNEEQAVLDSAHTVGSAVILPGRGSAGVHLVLAVPYRDGSAVTVIVAPRTRLIADDPFTALIGVAGVRATEPPYSLALERGVLTATEAHDGRWLRKGDELHGDWMIASEQGRSRVHVEVELRSLVALVPRGALIVILDVVLLSALWTLVAASDGGFRRWTRTRVRGWRRSYRSRLIFSLFGFFVLPAVVFAIWSYRRLQGDDQQSRELLVRETLRSFVSNRHADSLNIRGQRLEAPLFLYADGEMRETSDSLYDLLAPVGRFLPRSVAQNVVLLEEVNDSKRETIAGVPALFGYRAVAERGRRYVLAAPARTDELTLDRQRHDLGILVLFATAIGALAALGLSGVAARAFARPIGELRLAALAVAAGEAEPALADEPPVEFQPVFSAFRRMASDLAASRSALEEAQRRTEAVLRNVASGVVATDPDGRITLANPPAEALLSIPLVPGADLVVPDAGRGGRDLATRVRAFARADADEEELDLVLHGRQLHVRLTRLRRGIGGVVVTLDDVTELARAQRVIAWGEMARQVAHEIKNPLTPIRLGVQHLKRAYRDGRGGYDRVLEQNVGRILAEIDRLDEIARAFSRYGTAPAERAPGEPIDVAAVVRDVVELERIGEGEVQWRLEGADDPVIARARGPELREVLLNVLENARLANARCVQVRLAQNDARAVISVSDDGDGIPPDVLPRIFEPHFSTRTSGSGLGLALSRSLVEAWGGEIRVESGGTAGTQVTIALAAPSSASQL